MKNDTTIDGDIMHTGSTADTWIPLLPSLLPSPHGSLTNAPAEAWFDRLKRHVKERKVRICIAGFISVLVISLAFTGIMENYGSCPCNDLVGWYIALITTCLSWWVPSPAS